MVQKLDRCCNSNQGREMFMCSAENRSYGKLRWSMQNIVRNTSLELQGLGSLLLLLGVRQSEIISVLNRDLLPWITAHGGKMWVSSEIGIHCHIFPGMGGVVHVAVKGRAEDRSMSIGKIWQRETTEEELRSADALDREAEQSTDLPFKSVDKQKHQHLSSFCYHLTANTHKFELCAFII